MQQSSLELAKADVYRENLRIDQQKLNYDYRALLSS